jgi:hypothetical protein
MLQGLFSSCKFFPSLLQLTRGYFANFLVDALESVLFPHHLIVTLLAEATAE